MAISNINPIDTSVLLPGDSFAFDIDDTYTSMLIKVETSGGTEIAYDSTSGGAQAGYSVAVTIPGAGLHRFTISRSAGFNETPFVVTVTENETGSSATTTFTYYLSGTGTYPDDRKPYYGETIGSLQVTDDGVQVRTDVGWVDLVGFTVTDLGNGKVRITDSGGGGGGFPGLGQWTLSSTVTDSDPGAGVYRLNNVAQASATYLYVSITDASGVDMGDLLDRIKPGDYLKLQNTGTQGRAATFVVNGTVEFVSTYRKIPVAFHEAGTSELNTSSTTSFVIQPSLNYGQVLTFAAASGTPGVGEITTNDTVVNNVTTINLSENASPNQMAGPYSLLANGDYLICHDPVSGMYATYVVNGNPIDQGSYYEVPVLVGNGAGTWTVGNPIHVTRWAAGGAGGGTGIPSLGNWTYDNTSTVSAGLSTGTFRLNNSDPGIATEIYLSDFNSDGLQVGPMIQAYGTAGDQVKFSNADADEDFRSKIVSSSTGGGINTIVVTPEVDLAATLTNGEAFGVTFAPLSTTPYFRPGHLLTYTCSSIASGVPASGECSFNASGVAAAITSVLINEQSDDIAVPTFLGELKDNDWVFMRERPVAPGNAYAFRVARINGTPTDNGTYWTIPIDTNEDSNLFFSVNDTVEFFFYPTADAGGGGGGGGLSLTLASNQSVAVDATQVVVGGGYIDGSTGGTYSWNATFIYNDGGGTGTQDLSLALYNDAGLLISILALDSSVDGLDTLVYKSQALTAGTPTIDGDIILNAGDIYEVRAFIDAGGSVDSVTILSCEFVEA